MTNARDYKADVVICGAGTAGSVAAIAAADQGLNVLLIEQSGAAGGSGSIGLVTPMMNTGIAGNPMCSYVGQEINRSMLALGAAMGDGSRFDPAMLSFVLEKMLLERSARIPMHTSVTGAQAEHKLIRSVQLFNKSGTASAHARVFIDATGDGDLCALAGLPMLHGDEPTGKNQPVSLRYIVGGVDTAAFRAFLEEHGAHMSPDYLSGAVTTGTGKTWPLSALFDEAIAQGELTADDAAYWQFFSLPGRADSIAFNCPEFFDLHDADDAESLTHVQLHGKQAILRQLLFYRRRLRGFENAYVSSVASLVGVRESRRAVTDYIVTTQDVMAHQKFDDAICQSNYPMDVHGRRLNCENIAGANHDTPPYYEVPLRALVARDADNLLVCGRHAGAEFIAQSSMRIMPTCRAMGEAAAIAAAMACEKPCIDLHAVDGALVRAEMQKCGARFAQDI